MGITINKRGKYYHLVIHDPRIGRYRKSLKTKNKTIAEKIGMKFYEDMLLKLEGVNQITISEAVKFWLERAISKKALKGVHDDRFKGEIVKSFFSPGKKLSEIKSNDIDNLISFLLRERKLSHASVNRYLAFIKSVVNYAIECDKFEGRNPVRKTHFFKESPNENFFSLETLLKIIKKAKEISEKGESANDREFIKYIALCSLGLRSSESFRLKNSDWNRDEGYLKIWISKTKKPRTVPVPDIIADLLNFIPPGSADGVKILAIDSYLIKDVPRWSGAFRNQWKRLKKELGIHGRMYDLKHSFATILAMIGVDMKTVQYLLGHQSINTTLRIYSHTNFLQAQKAITTFQEALTNGSN